MHSQDLFTTASSSEELDPGACVLRGFAADVQGDVWKLIGELALAAPFRHLTTPGGYRMSVAMTNCGDLGWTSDTTGYRYTHIDPLSGQHWPRMPALFQQLAQDAALQAGYADYRPDACLINRYAPGAKLSLHRDQDEKDATAPIVSVSLGVSAVFLWGGLRRQDRVRRTLLHSGDVVVWGGPSRFVYHGIAALGKGFHPLTGPERFNLTFRKVF
jgi:alkylated DNA repair protein (DNA oxidative demethylase)